ncbi:MAG: isoprenylcysteine carboxylmethyltransferase family protein [Rubrivivax sp.]
MLAVLAATIVPMMLSEALLYRAHRHETSGLAAAVLDAWNLPRIGKKLLGFWFTIAVLAAIYWALPEYQAEFYRPFLNAMPVVLLVLAPLSVVYIAYVDARQSEPRDAYVEVAELLGGRTPADWTPLLAHARSWLVKGFFLPLMFVFTANDLADFWSNRVSFDLSNFGLFYDFAYRFLYFCDVIVAAVGYLLTLRLFDAHIRSSEPTVLGWVVCLICYPPFWSLGSSYFAYDRDGATWGTFFWNMPVLYVVWGSIILALIAIYVLSTTAFGLRFSNLTHRGIITSGPYRWVKHPAYLSKNLTWWMISVPFLTTGDWTMAVQNCLLLVAMNLVYFMRAVTEERHLSKDPVYREYQAFIAEHGLVAIIRRRLAPRAQSATS